MQTVQLFDAAATDQLGASLAAQLTAPGAVLLEGDLGAGKTSLARAMIRTLTGEPNVEVPSPTFTLLQTYESDRGPIYHYDLYRLKAPDEVFELDWEAALAEAIVLVEWPERLSGLRPRNAKTVRLENSETGRQVILEGFAEI